MIINESKSEYNKFKSTIEKAHSNNDLELLKRTKEAVMYAPSSRLSNTEARELFLLCMKYLGRPIKESISNKDFRYAFDDLTGSTQDRIDQVKKLIDNASKGLKEHPILTSNDFMNKSKNELIDTISYLCYKGTQEGDFIKVDGTLMYYCYNNSLVNIGYMYNIAKGAMTARNVFGSAKRGDAYVELKYKLDHSKLSSISVLS